MMKTSKMIVGCLGILALSATLTACSDDDNDSPVTPPDSSVSYVWGTDGGFKSCDHVLFDAEGKEAPEGKVIGNGDQNFVFKGVSRRSPKVLICCEAGSMWPADLH